MKTQHTHLTPTHPQGTQGKEAAMRWLAQQLRWERLLDDLRGDAPRPTPVREEEAA